MASGALRAHTLIARRALLVGALGALTGTVVGCAEQSDADQLWHHGRLYIATGNTTGVFYQFGGGYADIISRHVPGYQATAEPTNASVENVQRVLSGDSEIGLTFADVAVDAVLGRDPFAGPSRPLQAIARIYDNYTHLIARTATGITGLNQLRGKRVSTGTRGSGTENVALRILRAAGLNPETDIVRLPLSLPETVQGMANGSVDALFWTAGLPTIGISDLVSQMGNRIVFIQTADLLPKLRQQFGDAYIPATIDQSVYDLREDVPTVAVGAMIVVGLTMPEPLAHDITRVLFEYQADLARAHPEGRNFNRDTARHTNPVQLHPGAARYYGA